MHPSPVIAGPRESARGRSPDGLAAWSAAVRESVAVITFAVFLLSVLWAGVSYQIRRDAVDATHSAEVQLTNLTRAFAEHTGRTIEAADQALRFVRREYLDQGRSLDIAGYLQQKAIIDSTFHLISIIGPDGIVTHSSQPFKYTDLREREHFRVHADGHGDRLFVSKPVLGRVSGKWSIQLTRRIDLPDGSFGGVVVLSLTPEYLTRFYSEVDLGPHGAVTLVGYDGVVRARATRDSAQGSQDLRGNPIFEEAMRRKSGTLSAVSKIDGVERVWAFRALDEYGLLVFTGVGRDEVMAEPRRRRDSYLIGALLITLVIAGFAVVLVRRARLQHALMRQLEESNRQAQAANQMKTRFLASVSHELRTPLNGILGYAEMLKDTAPDEESRECGQIIHQSAKHLHSLVNTILDLAKIESGRMRMQLAGAQPRALLAEACALGAPHAQSRGLELTLQVDPSTPERIVTDTTRLTQVLNNLVHNAIKFTDRGGVAVRARGERGPDGEVLAVDVADTGIGIPPALLETVFTRFHSTTAEFVHPAQGAGLGLPLAHELVELLGGTIAIESTPGAGTTVRVRLPVGGPTRSQEPDSDE
jgi:signal transduction histidine kinase